MTKIEIKRVVIACDAAADMRRAIGEAAALAAQWSAELHGIYLEDENLHRLAELEIVAHIGLSEAQSPATLTGAALKETLQIYGSGMRRTLEAAARQHRLSWSFGTLRISPTPGVFSDIEGDILIVEAGPQPFTGSWRPRLLWLSAALDTAGTVLLRRRHSGHGCVVVAPNDPASYENVLSAAFALAAPGDEIVILCTDPRAREIAQRLGTASHHQVRFEALPGDINQLLERLAQLDPALLVISAKGSAPDLRALADGTRCDLLLVK